MWFNACIEKRYLLTPLETPVSYLFQSFHVLSRLEFVRNKEHTSLSPRLGGRLNLVGAVWAVKLICTLLVEKSCLAFFKICLKIHFYTSNVQISFTAQTAPPKFSLPPRRGLNLVCSQAPMFSISKVLKHQSS